MNTIAFFVVLAVVAALAYCGTRPEKCDECNVVMKHHQSGSWNYYDCPQCGKGWKTE